MEQPNVQLLIDQTSQTYALAVNDILIRQFGLHRVTIRSSHTPPDRLLQQESRDTPTLYVVLGTSTSSTAVLESDSAAPIITLSVADAPSTALSIARCCALANAELRSRVKQFVFRKRQARLIEDTQLRTSSAAYSMAIATCFDKNLQITGDKLGTAEYKGKVRNRYPAGDNLVALVATDRQSGFDRMLASVPFKGAVLNMTSAFWFEKTKDIIPNHLVSVPHPYVSICRKCKPFPIEFVVRYVLKKHDVLYSNSQSSFLLVRT